MVRAHGFYDPVQRAVITNECSWCRSICSTRLDAPHHACSLHGLQVEVTYKWKSDSRSCPFNVRCAERSLVVKVTIQSHSPLLAPNHQCRSSHPCLSVLTTSSGPSVSTRSPERGGANTALVARPFCGWHCTPNRETCSSTRTRRREAANETAKLLLPEE